MISAVRQTIYKAFGLRIASDIPLPELPLSVSSENGADADVAIATGSPDGLLEVLKNAGSNFARIENRFLFLIPDTAFYCIEDGRKITVCPLAGADPEKVRVYLLGTCMGALLMIRGVLPLHGSAVEIDGKAYAFLGDSGAGKSTLAAAFVSGGYRLVSDDVIAVTQANDGTAVVAPAYPQQKLWQESLDRLGMNRNDGNYRPVYRETTKYAVPVAARFCEKPVPLAGAFELLRSSGGEISVVRLPNLERLRVMMVHTYRNRLIHRLGLETWHFKTAAGFAERMDMHQLGRPPEVFTVNSLAAAIIHIIREGVDNK
ncbi:HPr kinase/phosphorylase [Paenibacillus glycinis]|uniref:Aldolase n=1 Tax=Paenibacillus glycinis TaxID=2697035 RepID=A0ABW9XUJ5_9BACL|nr:aldolase [Paenibacillus glycinis]NBD26349.1 aldolase [Paenibacillus glycinis]